MDNVESTRLQRALRNKAILANRQPANLKSLLTKAEFTSTEIKGCTSCTRSNCQLCSIGYVRNVDKLFSSTGAELLKLNTHFHCTSLTCLYYLTCPVCTKNYVGKTANFRERMNTHKTNIRNAGPNTIYADKHFNECITKRFGFLKEPLFQSTPFLYVKDDDKRDRLKILYQAIQARIQPVVFHHGSYLLFSFHLKLAPYRVFV